jgi:hypothetical protein
VAAAVPREIGCSGVTAWRRLRDWQATGVWDRLHHELLRRLNAAGRIDWSRGVVDGSHIRALQRGLTGPSAVDRGGPGSKHQLIVDASGVSLAASLTGGNRNDVTQLLPLVGAIGPVAGKRGRPASAPTASSPTAATTTPTTAASSGAGASNRSSPAVAPSTAPAWGSGGGSSTGLSPGCTTAGGS